MPDSGATAGGSAPAQELLLGYLPALAGPFATLSRTDEIAAQIAVDEINAAGGIGGKKIRIVSFDTAGKPDQAVVGLRKLAEDDKVMAVIGPFSSGECRVVFPVAERIGCRLEGPGLRHLRGGEVPSGGMVPGSVQVPPDGQPIVAMADGPTTGGYPKVATVVGADLPLLAQIVGGEGAVRFAAVSVEEAQRAARGRPAGRDPAGERG